MEFPRAYIAASILFVAVSIVCHTHLSAATAEVRAAQSRRPLTVSASVDRPYHGLDDRLAVAVIVRNNSGDDKRRSRVRLQLLGQPTGKSKRGSVRLRKTWWIKLERGENKLTLERGIRQLGLAEGVYDLEVTVDRADEDRVKETTATVVVGPQERQPLLVAIVWSLESRNYLHSEGSKAEKRALLDVGSSDRPGVFLKHLRFLEQYAPMKAALNIGPVAWEQVLARAAAGDRTVGRENRDEAEAAQGLLSRYREAVEVGTVELIPAPYGSPSLAFLGRRGWHSDATQQLRLSRSIAREAVPGVAGGVYLPDFRIDRTVLTYLAETGVSHTIVDRGDLETEPDGDRSGITLTVPAEDEAAVALFGRDRAGSLAIEQDEHPEMAAQRLVGALASRYLGSTEQDVAVIAPTGRPSAALVRAVYERLSSIPWIEPVTLEEARARLKPGESGLKNKSTGVPVDRAYVSRLREVRGELHHYKSAVGRQGAAVERLDRQLMAAQSANFTKPGGADEPGLALLNSVRRTLEAEWGKIVFAENGGVTLPGESGKIPVAITNGGSDVFKLTLSLEGRSFEFPDGDSQTVTLRPKENLFTFPVKLRRGSEEVNVTIREGDFVVAQSTITVRRASSAGQGLLLAALAVFLIAAVAIAVRYRINRRQLRKPSPS